MIRNQARRYNGGPTQMHLCLIGLSSSLIVASHRGWRGHRCRRCTHARCGHVGGRRPPAHLNAGERGDERRRGGSEDGKEGESREASHGVVRAVEDISVRGARERESGVVCVHGRREKHKKRGACVLVHEKKSSTLSTPPCGFDLRGPQERASKKKKSDVVC